VVNFMLALLCALLALWLVFKAGRWERRRKVMGRLHNHGGDETESQDLVALGLSSRLISSALMREDYNEVYEALKLTGKEPEKIPALYLAFCWVLPIALALLGILLKGPFIALFLGVIGFIGSRRYFRSVAKVACHRQNQEAIEFAQLLSMLLEAGLSIERAFRVAAVQSRPMIPGLVHRLDRFNRLMESGAERGVALDEIGEGKQIPVLHSLTRLLKQGGALGGAISESIEQLILEAQDVEKSRIKEEVNRVGAKMTVAMMIFMMPALFIIVGGPAGVNIVQAITR